MLAILGDGRAWTVCELARAAGISPQAAGAGLTELLAAGWVELAQEGRHRYYRLSGAGVAGRPKGRSPDPERVHRPAVPGPFRRARTCYDHLAGEIAVRLTTALERQQILIAGRGRDYELTTQGQEFFSNWGIAAAALRDGRRPFARRCLDRTERRDHLAGALGEAVLRTFFDRGWVRRSDGGRTVTVTPAGYRGLGPLLGADLRCRWG